MSCQLFPGFRLLVTNFAFDVGLTSFVVGVSCLSGSVVIVEGNNFVVECQGSYATLKIKKIYLF